MSAHIAVDIGAIYNDAQAWDCVSTQLSKTGEGLEDVDAPSTVFRCVPSAQTVANAYARVLRNSRTALATGARETSQGATALTEIAEAFRADEEAAAAAYDSMWEPLER